MVIERVDRAEPAINEVMGVLRDIVDGAMVRLND